MTVLVSPTVLSRRSVFPVQQSGFNPVFNWTSRQVLSSVLDMTWKCTAKTWDLQKYSYNFILWPADNIRTYIYIVAVGKFKLNHSFSTLVASAVKPTEFILNSTGELMMHKTCRIFFDLMAWWCHWQLTPYSLNQDLEHGDTKYCQTV